MSDRIQVQEVPEVFAEHKTQGSGTNNQMIENRSPLSSMVKPASIYITETGTALGRGVFAAKEFNPGEVVEVAPVVLVNENFQDLPITIQQLVFNWSRLTNSDIPFAVAVGFGSLYNHADDPNLRYKADSHTNTIKFIAERCIAPEEQLTINYNQVAEGMKPREKNWFETNMVEKIKINN